MALHPAPIKGFSVRPFQDITTVESTEKNDVRHPGWYV